METPRFFEGSLLNRRNALAAVLCLNVACGDSGGRTSISGGFESVGHHTTANNGTTDSEATTYPADPTDTPLFPNCGDGEVNADEGEQCDEGDYNANDEACTETCQLARCGDGLVGPGEGCDEGDENSDNGPCTKQCKLASCGNGSADKGEQCDGGPLENGDDQYCTSKCTNAKCGDGLVGPGETCDDKNHDPNDGCSECKLTTCGDGVVDSGEDCDDGNKNEADFCTTVCKTPSCTDGIVSGEEADIDCGGEDCVPCKLGSHCSETADCGEGQCISAKCQIANSCQGLLNLNANLENGVYKIDVDGPDAKPEFKAFCNMETHGGGWTGVMFVNKANFPYNDKLWTNVIALNPDNFDLETEGSRAKWVAFAQVGGTEVMSCQLSNFNVCYQAQAPQPFSSATHLFDEVVKDGYEIEDGFVWFFDDMAPPDVKRSPTCIADESVGFNQKAYLPEAICDSNNAGARFGQRVYSGNYGTVAQGLGTWSTHINHDDTSQILFVR